MEIKRRLELLKSNTKFRIKTKMSDRAIVSEKLKAAELCLKAVKHDGMMLRLVPRKFKTTEICLEAIKQNGKALAYVPEKHKTIDLCTKAMNRSCLAYDFISQKLKRTIKKLAKIDYCHYDEIRKYPVEMLEILALHIYHNDEFSKYPGTVYYELLQSILSERVTKLNEVFEWADENKQTFLRINDKLRASFEKAYKEAFLIADELEKRIKENDDFINDYEIEITLTLYMKKLFPDENNASRKFGYVISEPSSRLSSQIHYRFNHYCYNKVKNEIPVHLDRSRSLWPWDEYFYDRFNIGGICYATYLLLESREWSFFDIVNIDTIWANIKVEHQNFIKDIKCGKAQYSMTGVY